EADHARGPAVVRVPAEAGEVSQHDWLGEEQGAGSKEQEVAGLAGETHSGMVFVPYPRGVSRYAEPKRLPAPCSLLPAPSSAPVRSHFFRVFRGVRGALAA